MNMNIARWLGHTVSVASDDHTTCFIINIMRYILMF